jgi:hypothetical protein
MVNDEPPKKIVENLFSTMYYIERKKIMFHIFSSAAGTQPRTIATAGPGPSKRSTVCPRWSPSSPSARSLHGWSPPTPRRRLPWSRPWRVLGDSAARDNPANSLMPQDRGCSPYPHWARAHETGNRPRMGPDAGQ